MMSENEKSYDSTAATMHHILRVKHLVNLFEFLLTEQVNTHDVSKLLPPEKVIFDEFTPKLKNTTFGSDEYKENINQMKPAIEHHNEYNRHHPEHFGDVGIKGMDLIDIVEMLLDWKAASERHADGDILKSLEIQQIKLGYDDTLKSILLNTIQRVWALDGEITES